MALREMLDEPTVWLIRGVLPLAWAKDKTIRFIEHLSVYFFKSAVL